MILPSDPPVLGRPESAGAVWTAQEHGKDDFTDFHRPVPLAVRDHGGVSHDIPSASTAGICARSGSWIGEPGRDSETETASAPRASDSSMAESRLTSWLRIGLPCLGAWSQTGNEAAELRRYAVSAWSRDNKPLRDECADRPRCRGLANAVFVRQLARGGSGLPARKFSADAWKAFAAQMKGERPLAD